MARYSGVFKPQMSQISADFPAPQAHMPQIIRPEARAWWATLVEVVASRYRWSSNVVGCRRLSSGAGAVSVQARKPEPRTEPILLAV